MQSYPQRGQGVSQYGHSYEAALKADQYAYEMLMQGVVIPTCWIEARRRTLMAIWWQPDAMADWLCAVITGVGSLSCIVRCIRHQHKLCSSFQSKRPGQSNAACLRSQSALHNFYLM